MEKEKNNGGLVALVIVLFLLVLGLGGYIIYDKILSNGLTESKGNAQTPVADDTTIAENSDSENTVESNNNANNSGQETTIKYFYDVKDLKVKALPEYQVFADISQKNNAIERIYFGSEKNYTAVLDLSGNVNVRKYRTSDGDKEITGKLNITGVIDAVLFELPAPETEQLLYMLTDNGNVYYYRIGDIEKNSFNATKVESVSNVKRLFISTYSKKNAGGSWALFAITGNNDCIMIKGASV